MRAVNVRHSNSEPARTCDLAVLAHEFPKLSETFVLGDLLALEDAGLRLNLFSVRTPQTELAHGALDRLRADVEYLPELKGRQLTLLLRATQAMLFVRDPRRYATGLAEIYASPDYTRLRLQQALLLARRLDQIGRPPLYIHFAHKPATIGRFASLLLGTPFAISAHAVDVWTSPARELRAKFRDAQVVLCCYREAQDYVSSLTGGHTPVELAHHGVVVPPAGARQEASPPVLLSVGRLVEKKGFDTLLHAARLLYHRGLDFRLRIVGDGPLWAELQRIVNELELGELVRFVGPLTTDELEGHYADATAFVLASQVAADGNRDGLPNTLLEAMARQVPVVSSTLPSIAEAIDDGEHGLLVAPRDSVALADAIARLLGDRALRERLASSARARVSEHYDRAALAPRVEQVLRSAGMFNHRAG
jgi:glycosyltransferase involved in cell wall biosynthesis